jgi:hypothetical protein
LADFITATPVFKFSVHTGLALTTLGRGQYCLNVPGRPPSAQWQNARPTFVVRPDQCLIADLVVDANQLKLGLWLPVQRNIKITRKYLPAGPVIQFHDVALGMGPDLHGVTAFR